MFRVKGVLEPIPANTEPEAKVKPRKFANITQDTKFIVTHT